MNSIILPTGKSHISPSELMQWAQCSWKHKRAQVDKADRYTPSPIPTFGTAVHEGQENFLKTGKMDVAIAHSAIDRLWNRCGFKDHVDKNDSGAVSIDPLTTFLTKYDVSLESAKKQFGFTDKSRADAHRDADAILAEVPDFMAATFPNWQFIDAEYRLHEAIADTGVSMKGFIDCIIAATGKRGEGVVWIIDWKTSAWGWKLEKKQDPLVQNQLVLYKRFWMQKNAATNLTPKNVKCGFVLLKRTAKKGMHCELVPVSVGDITAQRAERRVLNMISAVKVGNAVKDRSSCLYCEYNTECVGTWIDNKGMLHTVRDNRSD